jgi:hypothetical protein
LKKQMQAAMPEQLSTVAAGFNGPLEILDLIDL